ncbi:hypothetical protein BpHYR1_047360 [Brachionus plicatilis]|uniref:Uncharacterized protein n=1 Tax=Brachionus plicatilis TaxID=10195 RepID=A0A3M7RUA6_BRAPC|nr:hypothetical protein BpHYR1_047360 [Brachionus plicatilis]
MIFLPFKLKLKHSVNATCCNIQSCISCLQIMCKISAKFIGLKQIEINFLLNLLSKKGVTKQHSRIYVYNIMAFVFALKFGSRKNNYI